MIPLRDVIPSRTTPYITITIIVLNGIAWLFANRYRILADVDLATAALDPDAASPNVELPASAG